MPIDPSKPADSVAAVKGELRDNLQAAKDGIEAGIATVSGTTLTVNDALFGDHQYVRRLFTSGSAIAVTLDDASDGRVVELVREGAGDITAAPGSGAELRPTAGSGNWPAGLHSTTDLHEALIYTTDGNAELSVAQLGSPQASATNNPTFAVSAGSNRMLVVGTHHEAADIVADQVSVTYGGQAMTRRVFLHSPTGTDLEVALFTLNDAGIAAASGTTIAVTGLIGANFTIHAIAFQNVHQSAPVPETDTEDNPTLAASQVIIEAGDRSAVVAISASGATSSATWTGLTERTDQNAAASTAGSLASAVFASGQSVTGVCTWSTGARSVIAGLELAPASGVKVWRQVTRPPVGA